VPKITFLIDILKIDITVRLISFINLLLIIGLLIKNGKNLSLPKTKLSLGKQKHLSEIKINQPHNYS